MAYADYTFYTEAYFGDTVPESDFPKWAERASDFLDAITFGRLANDFPTNADFEVRIEKAACAVAERLYLLDIAEQAALDAAKSSGGGSSETTSGGVSGAIKSRSAGSESISYETASEKASTAKQWSAVFAAAGNEEESNKLLYNAAKMYLMGVFTDKGVPVLFGGVG